MEVEEAVPELEMVDFSKMTKQVSQEPLAIYYHRTTAFKEARVVDQRRDPEVDRGCTVSMARVYRLGAAVVEWTKDHVCPTTSGELL